MTRPTAITLNLGALRANLGRARHAAPGAKVVAAVKANAYGHGLARIAGALDAHGFGVATIDEAESLRNAGIHSRIVALEGFVDQEELDLCGNRAVDVVIHHIEQVRMIEISPPRNRVRAWVKLDTGMHRLGFEPSSLSTVLARLLQCQAVHSDIVIISHLGRADERKSAATREQLAHFTSATSGLTNERSLANSAGVLAWPATHFDFVRPGIMLYGASPFPGEAARDHGLAPVMTFHTRIIAINRRRAGAAIGYGGTWTCPEDMDVAVAAVGYGDGYPRHLPSGAPVLVNGRFAPIVGRVSMDTITIDLRGHPDARVGDAVVLWGEGLPVEVVAEKAGSISYELLCGVSARVHVQLEPRLDAE